MIRTNNELENLIDLFSNFYQTIITNEPDKDKLKTNLNIFLSTFDHNDINFSKTQDFLRQMKGGQPTILANKTQDFSKFLPATVSFKSNIDYESFTADDYLNNYTETMNEMALVEDRFPVNDVKKMLFF